jgi:hypothetical protein
MLGGKPDTTQILIALPNGGQQLIPAEWTDQANQIQYPPGALFSFERLVVLRKRLDHLLAKEEERAILMVEEQELDRPGGSHVNQRSTNPLESFEPGTTCPDCCHPGTDAATPMDTRNGGAA